MRDALALCPAEASRLKLPVFCRAFFLAGRLAVNLPVKNLDRSVGFFTQLGFSVNPRLSGDTTAHLVISDEISAILVAEELFNNISRRHVADTATIAEVIVQLQLGSRERVDELVDAAIGAGGQVANPPNDQGFL